MSAHRSHKSYRRVSESILESIGDTPLVRLEKSVKRLAPTILAKVESFNPGGSTKANRALHDRRSGAFWSATSWRYDY